MDGLAKTNATSLRSFMKLLVLYSGGWMNWVALMIRGGESVEKDVLGNRLVNGVHHPPLITEGRNIHFI